MNRYLPVQGRRCATAGMVLVTVMAICGTSPFWIGTAALILAAILTAMFWKRFVPEQSKTKRHF